MACAVAVGTLKAYDSNIISQKKRSYFDLSTIYVIDIVSHILIFFISIKSKIKQKILTLVKYSKLNCALYLSKE
jgi:hypothetical protein